MKNNFFLGGVGIILDTHAFHGGGGGGGGGGWEGGGGTRNHVLFLLFMYGKAAHPLHS